MPMAGRSPARFLAPLALVAFALALFIVVTKATNDDRERGRRAQRALGPRDKSSEGNKKKKKRAEDLHGQGG